MAKNGVKYYTLKKEFTDPTRIEDCLSVLRDIIQDNRAIWI